MCSNNLWETEAGNWNPVIIQGKDKVKRVEELVSQLKQDEEPS